MKYILLIIICCSFDIRIEPTPIKTYFVILEYKINGKIIDQKTIKESYSFFKKDLKIENNNLPIDLYEIDSLIVTHNDTSMTVDFKAFLPFVINNDTNPDPIIFDINYLPLDSIHVKDSVIYRKTLILWNGVTCEVYKNNSVTLPQNSTD